MGDAPGLQTEAAQLALGLAARGNDVIAIGQLGLWRHTLRLAKITATDFTLPGDENRLLHLLQEHQPQMIHAFGADAAHVLLPLTTMVGASGVATLGHSDLSRVNPVHFRTASAVFVPCEYLREQVERRLPTVPTLATGYLLPPAVEPPCLQQRILAEEIGLRDDAPMLLLADQFRGSETEVALALIESVPLIARHVPDVQVVIAGSGMRLGELEALAIEVNNWLGYRAVLLPGHRDDIHQLLHLATIAVGSGRFAMEAVGAGVALVAAGASGIIGTYTEETIKVAQFTCCGRHGHLEPATPKALASEIVGLCRYPDYRVRFAMDGQEALLAHALRDTRAEQIVTTYTETAPAGTFNQTPQRITAILPDDLRELLFTLPALHGLRERYPHAQLTLIAGRQHLACVQHLHLAERVLPKPDRLRDWPRLARALASPRADIFLSFTDDNSATLLAGCSFASTRLGCSDGNGSILLSDHLQAQPPDAASRAVAMIRALGATVSNRLTPPELPLESQETVNLSLLRMGIHADDPVILLCPQSDAPYAWHLGHWPTLARLLTETRSERVVVLGADGMRLPAGILQAAPVYDSLTLAALLARAAVVIAPDSGILHLADLMGVPTIGLFGPTAPDANTLPNPHRHPLCHREFTCHPCGDTPCQERHCLRALTPNEVAETVAKILVHTVEVSVTERV